MYDACDVRGIVFHCFHLIFSLSSARLSFLNTDTDDAERVSCADVRLDVAQHVAGSMG